MSTSETDRSATSALDPADLSKQTQIAKENTETDEQIDRKLLREKFREGQISEKEGKISEKEEKISEKGIKVNDVRLAAVNEVKQSENSSVEMPNKTAPSRRIPHLHKLEK